MHDFTELDYVKQHLRTPGNQHVILSAKKNQLKFLYLIKTEIFMWSRRDRGYPFMSIMWVYVDLLICFPQVIY